MRTGLAPKQGSVVAGAWQEEAALSEAKYVIRGGAEGRKRMQMIARCFMPSTIELLQRVGIRPGLRCLDVACGPGDVTFEMARLVGPAGSAVGIDMDEAKLAFAREDAANLRLDNTSFESVDVTRWRPEPAYDLTYARFLLTHLSDPLAALTRMMAATRPGGVVVVEDIDYSGIVSYPPSAAVERHVELYEAAVRGHGGDPRIGYRLPSLLTAAGLEAVGVNAVQLAYLQGEGKLAHAVTTEAIAPTLLADGLASESEIASLVADLEAYAADATTLSTFPRVFQAWGYRPK